MTLTAVIGLGTMGSRIAHSISAGGHEVRGFDPSEGAREKASDSGITVFDTAEEALQGADLAIISVPRPEHVLASARGPLSTARGAVVADMSTIDPGSAQEAAGILAKHDVTYVDAPVLAGRTRSAAGRYRPVDTNLRPHSYGLCSKVRLPNESSASATSGLVRP